MPSRHGMISGMPHPAQPVRLPEGSSLDLAMIIAVAEVSNRAHHALGTRLLALEANGSTTRARSPRS